MTTAAQVFRDSDTDRAFRAKLWSGRVLLYVPC